MRVAAAALLTATVLTACTAEDESAAPTREAPTTTATPTPSPTPPPDPRTLPAQFDRPVVGADLRGAGDWVDVGPYSQREVRFESDDVTVSGVLFKPDGDGPFPAVVLNHGYIDPAVYQPGQGMPREQDWFARRGWVVLHVDYRGHAGSDDTGALDRELRIGYSRDSIAAVKVLKERADVDPSRVGMLGRSMGGGVTLGALVIEPDVVDAAVIHSSVSSQFVDNFRRWTEDSRPDQARELEAEIGSVDEAPETWAELSPRTYFDRVEASVLAIHGEQDDSCPVDWAHATQRALRGSAVDATLEVVGPEGHTFAGGWADKMERTRDFLEDGFR